MGEKGGFESVSLKMKWREWKNLGFDNMAEEMHKKINTLDRIIYLK